MKAWDVRVGDRIRWGGARCEVLGASHRSDLDLVPVGLEGPYTVDEFDDVPWPWEQERRWFPTYAAGVISRTVQLVLDVTDSSGVIEVTLSADEEIERLW